MSSSSHCRVVVCATGTEVGKTHVSCAMLRDAVRVFGDTDVAGLKPVESGVTPGAEATTDASRLGVASRGPVSEALFAYAEPISPHLAARREGRPVDLGAIAAWVGRHARMITLVETAGGLLSPLSHTATNRDLLLAVAPTHVVLVAPDRLGVLHDVSAALLALDAVGQRRGTLVVLSEPAETDASTGSNADELVGLGLVSRVVSYPRSSSTDGVTARAAMETWSALGVSRGT